MILFIDNYDSFVHNVARYFANLGAPTEVVRNDRLAVADIRRMGPEAIVISPGPCTPAEAGISCDVIGELSGEVPILGICLGHQCIGQVFGARTVQARQPLHGQASAIAHSGRDLFASLPSPMIVGRYHSLIVEPSSAMEAVLRVDAVSQDGAIMALSHRHDPTWGVQFHPESVLTEGGSKLFGNFLAMARVWNHALV
jgi:para-aminobenzoate synthetase component 2